MCYKVSYMTFIFLKENHIGIIETNEGTHWEFPGKFQTIVYVGFLFSSGWFNLLQPVFIASLTAVYSRPSLHNCVAILFLSSGIVDCMLYTSEYRSSFMSQGTSVVWHLSILMMNSFNISPCRICFRRTFTIFRLI